MPRYFEDFAVGDRWEFGTWTPTREELVAFAREHDPQPIHTDEAFAAGTPYGGVIASGWQTTLKCIRMFVDGLMRDTAGLASPGVDELRWLKPVRPGDTLSLRMTILETIPSRTKPDRGLVRSLMEMRNQRGEVVLTIRGLSLLGRRPA